MIQASLIFWGHLFQGVLWYSLFSKMWVQAGNIRIDIEYKGGSKNERKCLQKL